MTDETATSETTLAAVHAAVEEVVSILDLGFEIGAVTAVLEALATTPAALRRLAAGAGTDTSGEDGLHRDGQPITDAEFRAAADHMWLNGFACVRPTDEFAADVGRMVIAKMMESPIRTAPLGDFPGSRACVLWFNAS